MAFVHLKSFRHYQPPHATGRPIKGRSVVLNRSASQVSHKHNDTIAIAPNIGSSSKLEHFDLVERVNLTDSLPMEAINLFSEPALDYGCTKVLHSRGPPTAGPSTGNEGNNAPLPSLEEPLGNVGDTAELQRMAATSEHRSDRADGAVEHPTQNEHEGEPTPGLKRDDKREETAGPSSGSDGDKREETTEHNGIYLGSKGSTSAEEQGGQQGGQQDSLSNPPILVPDSAIATLTLCKTTNHPVSGSSPPPLPLPPVLPPLPPADIALSPMSNTQTELNDGAPQNLVSGRSGEETEKVDKSGGHTRDGHNAHRHIEDKDKSDMTTAGATPDRCSSKRPADNTNFSEDSEGVPRPEKARRRDPIYETDNTGDSLSDLDYARPGAQSKPVFRRPPSLLGFQQRESPSSSRFNGAGDSQNNPLAIEDDTDQSSETGGSTRATSVESQIGPINPQSCHPREQGKAHGCLSAHTTKTHTNTIDRCTSPSTAVSKEDYGAAVVASPLSAIPPPLFQQSQAPNTALEELE